MPRLIYVTFLILSILFMYGSKAFAQFSEAGVEKLRVSIEAPDLTLQELEGGKISLKELRGKIILLNFFATW